MSNASPRVDVDLGPELCQRLGLLRKLMWRPRNTAQHPAHQQALEDAVLSKPAIRRLAEDPVMLTCLAMVHFNEGRLPDARARLYEAVVNWLLRAKSERQEGVSPVRSPALLARAWRERLAGAAMLLLASCTAGPARPRSGPVEPATSFALPPSSSVSSPESGRETDAPDAGESAAEEALAACPLATPEGEPPMFGATTVLPDRCTLRQWVLGNDGSWTSFPWEPDAPAGARTGGVPVALRALPKPEVPWPAVAPPATEVRYALSGLPQRCSLTLPGEEPREVVVQRYKFDDSVSQFAVLWPTGSAKQAVLLHGILFSPSFEYFAPAIGDMDGDGRDDVAFVSQGVGTCGGATPPDCALWWMDIVMTSTHTSSAPLTLVTVGTFDALRRRLGTDDSWSSVRWHGRIQRGAYEVRVVGPKGSHQWTASLSGGQLRVH
ncbi:MAG: hypothetical protein JW751_17895 [Polyangiaceae bacterium]|nr:hypothetical protein [Polyangiaceae bacterium]